MFYEREKGIIEGEEGYYGCIERSKRREEGERRLVGAGRAGMLMVPLAVIGLERRMWDGYPCRWRLNTAWVGRLEEIDLIFDWRVGG